MSIAYVILALAVTFARAGDPKVRKANRFAAYQEQEGVTLTVSWQIAMHSNGDFLPLFIAVSNEGKGAAEVDLANFSLKDEEGDTYRPASYKDVLSAVGQLGKDKRLVRDLDYAGLNTRATLRTTPSSFYPHEEAATQDGTTELMTRSQMFDFVYFQIPDRVKHGKLTLVAEGIIDAPAFKVTFQIPK